MLCEMGPKNHTNPKVAVALLAVDEVFERHGHRGYKLALAHQRLVQADNLNDTATVCRGLKLLVVFWALCPLFVGRLGRKGRKAGGWQLREEDEEGVSRDSLTWQMASSSMLIMT